MRALWVAVVASGCLKSTAPTCSSGGETWVCPAGFACAEVGAYCGRQDDVAACSGRGAFGSCSIESGGAEAAGRCIFGVCSACAADTEADLEGCTYTGWKAMTAPTTSPLRGVWEVGIADVYAVGDGALFHYDGNAWATPAGLPPLATASLSAVWASGSDDVFVVGNAGSGNDVLHFDGAAWTASAAGASSETLDSVWGVTGSDVYAAGLQLGSAANTLGVIRQFDGSAWTTTIVGNRNLSGVWASSDLAIAVGGGLGSGQIWRSTAGGAWTQDAVTGPVSVLTGVWGSSDQDIYAVGHISAASTLTILHFDGASWSALAPCSGSGAPCIDPATDAGGHSLGAISGRGASDIYAVGDSGEVLHFDGTTWSIDPTPASAVITLDAVSPGSGEAFAVGTGEILRKASDQITGSCRRPRGAARTCSACRSRTTR